jgi:hypothetical protein
MERAQDNYTAISGIQRVLRDDKNAKVRNMDEQLLNNIGL